MARYGRKSRQKVKKAMHERKRGTLRSGRSGKKVKSRRQAIAIGGRLFEVVRGDLLKEPVDAIVNAANGRTTAGLLPFKGVIHAVGPHYGEGDEENKLFDALTASWERARENGWESVSFPAVSSGIFAVPLEICARAYLKAARASPLRKVRLCLRDQPVIDAVLKEMKV